MGGINRDFNDDQRGGGNSISEPMVEDRREGFPVFGGFGRSGGFNVPYDEDEERTAHHWTGLTHPELRKILRTERNAEEALLNIQVRARRVDRLTHTLARERNPIRMINLRKVLLGEARWLEAYLHFFKRNFPKDHPQRNKEFNERFEKTVAEHQKRKENQFYREAVPYFN